VLVDCHSMPSAGAGSGVQTSARPDFVIGDRFGTSCDGRVLRALRDALGQRGAHVQINRPYAGGFITEHYGRPHHGVHAIQLEINRALYLDERTLQITTGFDALRLALSDTFGRMIYDVQRGLERRAAAE
jgi:N-formylglutamate amidohydrolase